MRLAPAGMIGGALGTFVLTGIDGNALRPYIFGYLALMGVYIIFRVLRPASAKGVAPGLVPPLGAAGGFVDAVGGGGWGPIVTTTLVGAGEQPRYVIGTVNTSEFLVTVTISASFVTAMLTGHWEDAGDLTAHAAAIGGLVCGGLLAAPLAGYVVKEVSPRALGFVVGLLIIALSAYQIARFFKVV